jgi:hypothetical protein
MHPGSGKPNAAASRRKYYAERHRIYYMKGRWWLPQVRAVVSQMSLELPVACPSTKGAPEYELTNLLVGLMQVRVACHSS